MSVHVVSYFHNQGSFYVWLDPGARHLFIFVSAMWHLPPPPPKAPVHKNHYPPDWYKRYLPREIIYGPPQSPPPPCFPPNRPLSLDLFAQQRPIRVAHSIPVNLSTSKSSLKKQAPPSSGYSFAFKPWYIRQQRTLKHLTDLTSTNKGNS